MIHFLYNLSIRIYALIILLVSFFNSKAKLWVDGRKDIFRKIETQLKSEKLNANTVWFHCASLGEFEQGRPLMESIKAKESNVRIILTFFSPSGYEIRKSYTGADYVFYLPIDTPDNAAQFIGLIKPKAVFFVKYEFWFNYLNELKKQNIPTYLVSGIFRKDHYFFKFYGTWFRKQLSCFSHFYLQSEQSAQLLKSIGYTNVTVAGDTRFDRVSEISKTLKSIPIIAHFKQGCNLLIAGSTWLEDEKAIATLNLTKNYKVIIVPHEIDEMHLFSVEKLFASKGNTTESPSIMRYSKATENNIVSANILIIDNVGMLSSLYQYASIAYVGGGFGKGIHNIIEAATFGIPVIFGPNYHKFTEAEDLIKLGGAFTISSKDNLANVFTSLQNPDLYTKSSKISKDYVAANVGATSKILHSISFK
jgi:3-deoxy-D-manno-octulosonic-acid transferase